MNLQILVFTMTACEKKPVSFGFIVTFTCKELPDKTGFLSNSIEVQSQVVEIFSIINNLLLLFFISNLTIFSSPKLNNPRFTFVGSIIISGFSLSICLCLISTSSYSYRIAELYIGLPIYTTLFSEFKRKV